MLLDNGMCVSCILAKAAAKDVDDIARIAANEHMNFHKYLNERNRLPPPLLSPETREYDLKWRNFRLRRNMGP
jgi:hypothetical protein